MPDPAASGTREEILLMRGLIADLDLPLGRPSNVAVVYHNQHGK